jgi:hypothetical protein
LLLIAVAARCESGVAAPGGEIFIFVFPHAFNRKQLELERGREIDSPREIARLKEIERARGRE